ncbi:MAG: potassium-transporting ATPase subunit KdpC [Myxococcales bacterium]|nr:potassium-transporting ATPase subunit KdpC [Myxococcales bacterium]MCB9733860.1 potassium-transporting ATPase subunit KdpC [Deltaproteobacteria bacterium]
MTAHPRSTPAPASSLPPEPAAEPGVGWLATLRAAAVLLAAATVLCGLLYPLAVTGVAQLALPEQANGSLVTAADGRVVGSALVGQPFTAPGYFWGRPSATSPLPYDAAASAGSNLAASNPALAARAAARVGELRAADPEATGPVPADLVTTSASGLDPDISPAGALFQVTRVAHARGLDPARVKALVREHVEPPALGFLGDPRVNVLRLNLALDRLAGGPPAR